MTTELDYTSSAPIAMAFIDRYKDYRKAMAAGDGFEQCRAMGSMNLHGRRLREVFGYNEEMMQMLIARGQRELEQEKKKG